MLENIKVNSEKPNLYISDEDWDNFTQDRKINNLLELIND
jgi:hypothetical protein